MQAQNLIGTHWKKAQKQLEHQLALLKKKMDPEAIHETRVAVKKLRAILEFYLQFRKEPGYENLLEKTEEMFGVLGRQRDIEICLELLPRFEKENQYAYKELKAYLQQQLKKARGWSNRSIHIYTKKELPRVAHLLKSDPGLKDETTLLQSIRDTIRRHTSSVRDYYKKPHKLRQHLKQLYYWMDLLPADEFRRKELHSILTGIGDWQDAEIFLERVRHFRKDYLPSSFEENKMIKQLEEQLRTGKEKLRKDTLRKTTRWQKKLVQTG